MFRARSFSGSPSFCFSFHRSLPPSVFLGLKAGDGLRATTRLPVHPAHLQETTTDEEPSLCSLWCYAPVRFRLRRVQRLELLASQPSEERAEVRARQSGSIPFCL